MEKVIIASLNPVKIEAVKIGFQKMFPDKDFEFEGVSVPSGVSDQPMTNKETLTGAINRAVNANAKIQTANYWVGVEGGIEKVIDEMAASAWIVILHNNKLTKARTGAFFLPPKVTELINQGMELGEADDIVFGDSNSKQKGGAVGLLTDNVIDRTSFYVEAVILAAIPIKNKTLY